MTWQDVIDPEKGYIKDDTITLEVVILAISTKGEFEFKVKRKCLKMTAESRNYEIKLKHRQII